jgi:hypothetical protein
MTTTIKIQSQQSHISQYNRTESFISDKKARTYLLEWLDKLEFDAEVPEQLENGQFFDCRDYIVYIEIA